MGPFILGVLVGWLAEWLFYTFWVKAGDNQEDCSALKAELELKNRQISSLQTQLSSATEGSSNTTKAEAKSASSSTSSKPVKKSTSTSIKTNTAAKTATNKATAAKASTAKKASAIKKAPAKKAGKAKAGGDDFTKLTGIGPSMSATLKSLGIDTFNKLAATDDDVLRDMLEQSGAKMNNNKEAMDSWNEQATVAATGDFKALKVMQAALKK